MKYYCIELKLSFNSLKLVHIFESLGLTVIIVGYKLAKKI